MTTPATLPSRGAEPEHPALPPRRQILLGDATTTLASIPASSVDMVLTSPPYFRLRDYQADGQLGLEQHPTDWASKLRATARELARVLTPTGTLWLNLGDTYATHPRQGAARKSLLLTPERLALTLLDDGWILRNKIIWAKPNPVPSSVTDRLTCTWEVIYVFARSPRYFFDLDAIRLPHARPQHTPNRQAERAASTREGWRGPNTTSTTGLTHLKSLGRSGHPLGKNPGDVWQIATSGYRGAHHATFPLELAQRAIAAGCPEERCGSCQRPWARPLKRDRAAGSAHRLSLAPTCACGALAEPGLVLDPFMGAGTTAVAAEALGRDWLGVEINPAFVALARERIDRQRTKSRPRSRQPCASPRAA